MTVPILSTSRKGNVPTRDEHWSRERATFLRRSESSRCLIPPGPDPAASAASSSGFSPPSPRTNCTSACSSRTPAAGSSRIHVISLSALGRFSPGRSAGLVWTAEGSKSCRVSEPGTPQPKGASFCTRLQVLTPQPRPSPAWERGMSWRRVPGDEPIRGARRVLARSRRQSCLDIPLSTQQARVSTLRLETRRTGLGPLSIAITKSDNMHNTLKRRRCHQQPSRVLRPLYRPASEFLEDRTLLSITSSGRQRRALGIERRCGNHTSTASTG